MSAHTFRNAKYLSPPLRPSSTLGRSDMNQTTLSPTQYQSYVQHYEQYKDKVYTYLYYRTNQDALLAEDLAADTFLKAFNNYAKFESKKSFSAWIFTIARNTFWYHFRTDKPTDLLGDGDEIPIPADFLSALDNAFEKDRLLAKALNELPLKQKEILVLKYMQDLSNEEIAEALQTSNNNVRQKIHYAKQKLKQVLSSILFFLGL